MLTDFIIGELTTSNEITSNNITWHVNRTNTIGYANLPGNFPLTSANIHNLCYLKIDDPGVYIVECYVRLNCGKGSYAYDSISRLEVDAKSLDSHYVVTNDTYTSTLTIRAKCYGIFNVTSTFKYIHFLCSGYNANEEVSYDWLFFRILRVK